MQIFSHVTLGAEDMPRAIAFYDQVLGVLGLVRHSTDAAFAGYGHPDDTSTTGENSLWILKPDNGRSAQGGNGTNVALRATSRRQVDAFHAKAIALGGVDDGAPGLRADAHPNFYACYVFDLDGNKLVAVCHAPDG